MNEIYWDGFRSNEVKLTIKDDIIFLLFEGKSSEYRNYFSGKIELELSLEEQTVSGLIHYRYQDGSEKELVYVLIGAFEDGSWEYFTGNWEENGEIEAFEALLEVDEPEALKVVDTDIDNQSAGYNLVETPISVAQKKTSDRHGAMRQRAARSDARVRKIQRSIELYYGLPQGSVKLVNPDKSIIHPSAKIGTLRGRWMIDDV